MQGAFVTENSGFFSRFGQSIGIFFRNIPVFFLIPFAGVFLGVLADVCSRLFIWPLIGVTPEMLAQGGIPNQTWGLVIGLTVIMLLIGIVIGFIIILAPIFAMTKMDKNQGGVGVGDSISYAFGKLKSYIAYAWYAFWYISKWPLIVGACSLIALVVSLVTKNSAESVSTIFGAIAGFGGMVAAIVFMFFALIRGPRTVFGPYLLVDEDTTGKEALEKTVKLTENRWVDVVFPLLFFGVIWGVIGGVIGVVVSFAIIGSGSPEMLDIVGQIVDDNVIVVANGKIVGLGLAVEGVSALANALMGGVSAIFLFLMMRRFQFIDKNKTSTKEVGAAK